MWTATYHEFFTRVEIRLTTATLQATHYGSSSSITPPTSLEAALTGETHRDPRRFAALFRKLLVPLDGALPAESALEYALCLSRGRMASPSLISVVSAGSHPKVVADQAREASRYLDQVKCKFELPEDTRTAVRAGDPAAEILAEVRESQSDMVLLPDRSCGGRARGDLGRITSRLLLGSPVPVLIVRQEPLARPPVRHAIVLLDGSRLAEEAISPAAQVASMCGGELSLVTVLTGLAHQFGSTAPRWGDSTDEARLARDYLERRAEDTANGVPRASVQVIKSSMAEYILELEDPTGTVLALTTRGASGFSRWVVGGVADHVTRAAPAAILLIPPRMA